MFFCWLFKLSLFIVCFLILSARSLKSSLGQFKTKGNIFILILFLVSILYFIYIYIYIIICFWRIEKENYVWSTYPSFLFLFGTYQKFIIDQEHYYCACISKNHWPRLSHFIYLNHILLFSWKNYILNFKY